MGYPVVFSPSARRDLRDIVRYISLDAPGRAVAFGQLLIASVRHQVTSRKRAASCQKWTILACGTWWCALIGGSVEEGLGKSARFALAAVSADRTPCNLSNQWLKDQNVNHGVHGMHGVKARLGNKH